MTDTPERHPPLAAVTPLEVGATRIESWQPGAVVNLRGPADDAGFAEAVHGATGASLPQTPNAVARGDALTLLWLGPDEWLVVADPETPSPFAALHEALTGRRAAVTAADCSYAGIRLTGDIARAVLARGTPLDLHPRTFAPGQCAQTRLAKATVILWPADDALRLLVRRSMAGYLWRWLEVVSERINAATAVEV